MIIKEFALMVLLFDAIKLESQTSKSAKQSGIGFVDDLLVGVAKALNN